jgi:hypothetical protein
VPAVHPTMAIFWAFLHRRERKHGLLPDEDGATRLT